MSILTVSAAWFLDALFGDPENLPHPVRGIGRLIEVLEEQSRKLFESKKAAGIIVGIMIPGAVFVCTTALVQWVGLLDGRMSTLLSIILIYTCLSTRSLGQEAGEVLRSIECADIKRARNRVARIVGRDTDRLTREEIIRATVESVSENTVDGIISPLFYAFLGGAPLAMAYKAISTLDSMVGYTDERYREFGWFSARLDDAANYLPARFCLLIIPVAALLVAPGNMARTLRVMLRDGRKHPSPNSGFSEAGFAAALGIQLGGQSTYKQVAHHKPLLGDRDNEIEPSDIKKSIRMMWTSSLVSLVLFSCCAVLL